MMITISGRIINSVSEIGGYPLDGIKEKIVNIMIQGSNIYAYNSPNQLIFELDLRAEIINASRELAGSSMAFRTFRKSKCNTDLWERTDEGGFLLKQGINPSEAIKDIFMDSSKYGTECATAIIIIYYKALLGIFHEDLFDKIFTVIHLMDWEYIDSKLGVVHYKNRGEGLPGDCRYFKNPDVDPTTPEWQGENTIDLGDGTYYGHGIGIKTGEQMIQSLNRRRKSDATESAYLMDSATNPGYKRLYRIYESFSPDARIKSL